MARLIQAVVNSLPQHAEVQLELDTRLTMPPPPYDSNHINVNSVDNTNNVNNRSANNNRPGKIKQTFQL